MGLEIRDFISPGLRRISRQVKDPRPILEAAALQLASIAARSFNDPSQRVSTWAPLKPSTIAAKIAAGKSPAVLKRDLLLWRSWMRPDMVSQRNAVTIRSDRPYAAVQQFGSSKRNMPARPMLPFIGTSESAKLAPWAKAKLEKVAMAKLRSLLG